MTDSDAAQSFPGLKDGSWDAKKGQNPCYALPAWSVRILGLAEVRTRCSCKMNLKIFTMHPSARAIHASHNSFLQPNAFCVCVEVFKL